MGAVWNVFGGGWLKICLQKRTLKPCNTVSTDRRKVFRVEVFLNAFNVCYCLSQSLLFFTSDLYKKNE
jgi:hypothetical protein